MSEYTEQAEKFLQSCNASIEVTFLYTAPYFDEDTEARDMYQFIIKTPKGAYVGKFGDSLRNTQRRKFADECRNPISRLTISDERFAKSLGFRVIYNKRVDSKELLAARNYKPNAYDILACITKYNPDTFANFCSEFGYDTDSKKAEKIYFAVQTEWNGVRSIFTEEQLTELRDIN